MTLKHKLIRTIKRSETAYRLYIEDKKFFQALRIYKANVQIYGLLEDFVFECEEEFLQQVFDYIFHLEDWFESFHAAKISDPELDDYFAFETLPDSPKFPANFVEVVLNK